jgi:hypothetical protein
MSAVSALLRAASVSTILATNAEKPCRKRSKALERPAGYRYGRE